jgi:hypothetical protein
MHGRNEKSNKILLGKLEGKRPLESLMCGRKDNIKMDLRERRCEVAD